MASDETKIEQATSDVDQVETKGVNHEQLVQDMMKTLEAYKEELKSLKKQTIKEVEAPTEEIIPTLTETDSIDVILGSINDRRWNQRNPQFSKGEALI